MASLPAGTYFEVPAHGYAKYVAHLPGGRSVSFGDRRYAHYRDRVPKNMGGARWAALDHLDKARRARYRQRHGAIRLADGSRAVERRFSPAWFSWHFLW